MAINGEPPIPPKQNDLSKSHGISELKNA